MELEENIVNDLLRSMTAGVLLFDIDKNVIVANPMLRTITEVYRKDATFEDFVSHIEKQNIHKKSGTTSINLRESIQLTLTEERVIFFDQVLFRNKIYEIAVVPVHDKNRHISGGAIIIHDTTRVNELDRLKTEFVSLASHQLRTPLTAVRLYEELLLDEKTSQNLTEKQKENLRAIYISTRRMITLIDDMLSISHIEAQRLQVDPRRLDLKQFLEEFLEESVSFVRDGECSINIVHDSNLTSCVCVDPKLLRQALLNIITNAVRYSKNSGCVIEIGTKAKNSGDVILYVKDSGIGIPDKDKEHVYDKFFRAQNAVNRQSTGTGLGLYIAKMVVDTAGGSIWFDSKEGEGTTFYLQLPGC